LDTIPPVVADAYDLLQTDLYRHLDEAEYVAGAGHPWTDQDHDTACTLIFDLVRVIRGLLRPHQIQLSGHCPTCASPWPWLVVTEIHSLLKDPDRQFVALVDRARDA
jgi:hypothetical protein